MTQFTSPAATVPAGTPLPSSEPTSGLAALSALLSAYEDPGYSAPLRKASPDDQHQQRLASAKLGMASSLFLALRAKHLPTAAHSLRVAVGISSWGGLLNMPDPLRDLLEIAALLHDVGKIGVPDQVLRKPGRLTADEQLLMERQRQVGREIVAACCVSREVLDILEYLGAWFDGSRHGYDRRGEQIPCGARMLAIVDAFDSMTSDHVYRPAMSRERAMAELFACAATQFDPSLIQQFCGFVAKDALQLHADVSRRWLRQLQSGQVAECWDLTEPTAHGRRTVSSSPFLPFHKALLTNTHDAVAFMDQELQIVFWNDGAERMTGLAAEGIVNHEWTPGLVYLRDEQGKLVGPDDCPVRQALRDGQRLVRRGYVRGKNATISVDLCVAPVQGDAMTLRGAVLMLQDASSRANLEERVLSLQERATRDPLTKCSNRAEFDRVLPEFTRSHLDDHVPCSMIICDIDHFKRINDTYGHQAGDEALITFGALLQRSARDGDLVARYGGEEFVILCADCSNAAATRRAEEIRQRLAEQPQPSLNGQFITASFGVTEVQPGDTEESFLRRADRALLQAKAAGRNIVVQFGTGLGGGGTDPRPSRWLRWFGAKPGDQLLTRTLVTVVPTAMIGEKLKGFVADHHAQIAELSEAAVVMQLEGAQGQHLRRHNDRAVPFVIELKLHEKPVTFGQQGKHVPRTFIHVVIRPKRQRDRRRTEAAERAHQLLNSLKSYLVAQEYTEKTAVEPAAPSASRMAAT